MTIKRTMDYSIFKKIDANRQIDHKNLNNLIESIKFRNLLEFRPILVNPSMGVIDGQHRLEAAKTLGLEVYYEIDTSANNDIIPLLQTHKSWSLEDFANYYSNLGNINYVRFLQYAKDKKLPFSMAYKLVVARKDSTGFRRGLYVFPSGDKYIEIDQRMEKINYVKEFVIRKSGGIMIEYRFIHSRRFFDALSRLLEIQSVDFDVFMKKLEVKLDMLRNCATTLEFLRIFKSIYNWKNQNPITMEEDLIKAG